MHSRNHEDHWTHLQQLFSILAANGLALKLDKYVFAAATTSVRIRVDPYSNRRLDPDPYSKYGSGSSKLNLAIQIHCLRKLFMIFTFLK